MELRVEGCEGTSMPVGCYVGVRVGDVLKQGRYEPSRCYHFPQVDRRRNAKIDIYQHVGSCIVAVDPDTKSTHEVNVIGNDSTSMRLKVNVQSKAADSSKEAREVRSHALKSQAKDYLSKHSIEERLSEAVKALLKEQPADPTEFLCRQLKEGEAKPLPPKEKTEAAPPSEAKSRPSPRTPAATPKAAATPSAAASASAAPAPPPKPEKDPAAAPPDKAGAECKQASPQQDIKPATDPPNAETKGSPPDLGWGMVPMLKKPAALGSTPPMVVNSVSLFGGHVANMGMSPMLMFI